MKKFITSVAIELLINNITLCDAMRVFQEDYHILCDYMSGKKDMPIDLAFRILEYMNCNISIFNNTHTYKH